MDGKKQPDIPAKEPVATQAKKKSLPRRMLKWSLLLLVGTLAFLLVALLTLPLWISPVATSLANALVPDYTGTPFSIERVNLNPYTGKLLVSGVRLGNPDGYAEQDAFSLGSLSAEVEVGSLMSKTIHVVDVSIDAPAASYVFDAEGVNNFDRIIESVNKKLGPKEEKKEEPSDVKVVVDKVTIKNVRVVVANGKLELESLTLTDFGKDSPASVKVAGVKLVNPPGFEAENAFSLGSLSVGLETADLGKKPFRIHDLVVDSPYASYVFDDKDVDNFKCMLGPLLAKGGEAEAPKGEPESKKGDKAESAGTPVVLDRLEVRNLKATVCKGRFELASLVVTDFGNPTNTMVRLEGAKLANPDGFRRPDAFSLGSLSVGLETADLTRKPMAVHDVTVNSMYAGYVFNEAGDSNFDVMFKPLMGGGKKGGETKDASADDRDEGEKQDDKGGPAVVVDKVVLIDLRGDVGMGQFELKSLNLDDFGKATPAKLKISGVKLVNPPGFDAENAFSLGSLSVGLETADLGKKPFRIHDLVVDSPYASYVFDDKDVDNFKCMLGPLLAKGGEAEAPKGEPESKKGDKAESAGSPVALDRLEVRNLKATVCKGRFELTSLVVTDFGNAANTMIRLEGAKLANPDGFKRPDAFSLGSLSVGLETADLTRKPIVVHDVIVNSTYAGYVFNEAGDSNFDVMFKPLMGGGKKGGETKAAADDDRGEGEKQDGKGGPAVVVDKVVFDDLRGDVGMGQFELKSLNLDDFGKATPAKLKISGVKLVNPPGFEAENAFSLGSLSIGMETADLSKPPFKIHELVVDSPYASYVFDEKKVDNFTRMLEPLLAKGGAAKEVPQSESGKAGKESAKAGSSGVPVTLDRLEVKNVKSHVGKGRFELASLEAADFGRTNFIVSLKGASLMNPAGFSGTNAFSLASLSVELETDDLSKKPMVFHDIVVESPYVGFFVNADWTCNLLMLKESVTGDGKKDEGKGEVAEAKKKDVAKDGNDDSTRVMIDKLEITGTSIQVDTPVPILKGTINVPNLTYNEIGHSSKEGSTTKAVVQHVGDDVVGFVSEVSGPIGGVIQKVLQSGGALADLDAKKMLSGVTDALSASATNVFASATNVLGGASALIGGGATNVLGGASVLIGGGATNVLGGATSVLGGAKGTLGNAMDTTKTFVGGLLSTGGKKDDGEKDDGKKGGKNKGGNEPGVLNRFIPVNLLK